MKMILEIIKAPPEYTVLQRTMQFDEDGGKVGRNSAAKWVLEDHTKHISNFHAEISFEKGTYYITDISSNGIFFKNPHKKFIKNVPMPLIEGNILSIGMYDISVKSIDGALMENPTSSIRDNVFIPDNTFTDNSDIEALEVLNVDTHESSNILSLLGNTSDEKYDILPDLGTIMGLDSKEVEESNVIMQDSLSQHVDFDDFEHDEETPYTQNNLLNIFTSKLGITLEGKSQKEQEIFMDDMATLIKTLFVEANQASTNLAQIKVGLGIVGVEKQTPFSKTTDPSILLQTRQIEGATLSTHLQTLFKEINMHNITFLNAFYKTSFKIANQFSPQKLYSSLEAHHKFRNPLINKKALAWEVYNNNFRYLNNPENGKETIIEELRKTYLDEIKAIH